MGYGTWTQKDFTDYSKRMNRTVAKDGSLAGSYTNQQLFQARKIDPLLDPFGATRECCDSEDHPETLPVILALDVTGSMGNAAVEVAKKLNVIMTQLYKKIPDVQFMIMGIGDFAYDSAPLQVSQFEADIRIAEQLDRIYFEFGGGGNAFESYTAAWYFAAQHTRLDAWKRDKKGILITMGDEQLNPYIPTTGRRTDFQQVTGDTLQDHPETKDLYPVVKEKYDIYHLHVKHSSHVDMNIAPSWRKYLDKEHFFEVSLNNISDTIIKIILNEAEDRKKKPSLFPGRFFEKAAAGISW